MGKRFHTIEPAFLRRVRESPVPSVFKGRVNLRPTRWYPFKWVIQTVLARMAREVRGNPLAGPRGALGISSETRVDLGKARRTTTRAPPAPTFTAVANSSDSLPASSRLRIKTGMASCNRDHFRRSALGELRVTSVCTQNQEFPPETSHLRGQTLVFRATPLAASETSLPIRELPKEPCDYRI